MGNRPPPPPPPPPSPPPGVFRCGAARSSAGDVASGQRILILAILLNLRTVALRAALLVVVAFVAVAGLVMLAVVNDRVTKALKAAGYKVRFFGASGKRETVRGQR